MSTHRTGKYWHELKEMGGTILSKTVKEKTSRGNNEC